MNTGTLNSICLFFYRISFIILP